MEMVKKGRALESDSRWTGVAGEIYQKHGRQRQKNLNCANSGEGKTAIERGGIRERQKEGRNEGRTKGGGKVGGDKGCRERLTKPGYSLLPHSLS